MTIFSQPISGFGEPERTPTVQQIGHVGANDTLPLTSKKGSNYSNFPVLTMSQLESGSGVNLDVVYINESEKSGIFRYDPGDTSTPSDKAMVLVSGMRRYKRDTDYITPEMFGAKRNGKSDDAVPIQQALNYIAKVGGGKLVFATGVYLIGSTLKLKPVNGAPDFNYNITLCGSGMGITELRGTSTINGNLLEMTAGQIKFQGKDSRVLIRDLSFKAENADRCFFADHISQLRLTDCRFLGGQQYTVQLGSESPTQNYGIYVTRCYFGGGTTSGGLNKGTFIAYHCIFLVVEEMETDGGRIGVDLIDSAACIVNNSKIEGCKYAGIRISGRGNGEHRITNNYIICYGGLDFNAQFDGVMHGILVTGNNAGSSAANTIANNIIRLESPKTLNVVAKVDRGTKLIYNAAGNVIVGKKSGAKAHIWGINQERQLLVVKPISGSFQAGESISQDGTSGGAVLTDVISKATTYGIKLEGSNGSNIISGNQLTTSSTYGIHVQSNANMIVGNTINGATGIYVKANGISVTSNIFWCLDDPGVAIQRDGGNDFVSLNNYFQRGKLLGVASGSVIDMPVSSGTMVVNGLPGSPDKLPSGAMWIDKAAGNVVKVVP